MWIKIEINIKYIINKDMTIDIFKCYLNMIYHLNI